MTRIIWKLVKEKLIFPFAEVPLEYYDLGLPHRDATDDKVTTDAAEAIKRQKVAVKCATITPRAAQVKEHNLKKAWKSPNGTIRGAPVGTVFRKPITCSNIPTAVKSWTKPIAIGRHGTATSTPASSTRCPAPCTAEIVFTPAGAFDELIREAVEIVHGRLEEHGVSVHVHPNLSTVYGDRPRLVEVLQNLIDNAAKYMGNQNAPNIEIGQRGEGNGLPVFFVKDNGMGIAPEHHERVFGLFNKLDAKSEGTGVGLALVKRIIEVHGGRIWVESEPGMGAAFLFTLPSSGQAKA